MKPSVRARALALTLAAGSLALVPLAAPAWAAAAQPASCGALTTKTVGKVVKITVAKCTPLAATGGSGTGTTAAGKTGVLKGKLVTTITWAKGLGKTSSTNNFAPNTKGRGKCAVGTTRLSITGKVVSASGAVAKVIKVGQPVTASVCLTKSADASLEPGTVEKL